MNVPSLSAAPRCFVVPRQEIMDSQNLQFKVTSCHCTLMFHVFTWAVQHNDFDTYFYTTLLDTLIELQSNSKHLLLGRHIGCKACKII